MHAESAAPELLLRFESEVTMSIDIWALGCVTFELFAGRSPFVTLYPALPTCVANIVEALGMNTVPERFRDVICKMVAGKITEEGIERREPMWDRQFELARGDPEEDDRELLPKDDEEILRMILAATLVIDPIGRKSAATVLAMIPNGWELRISA
jgi:serine/threonine protein kinase